jgi:hypothetical protein
MVHLHHPVKQVQMLVIYLSPLSPLNLQFTFQLEHVCLQWLHLLFFHQFPLPLIIQCHKIPDLNFQVQYSSVEVFYFVLQDLYLVLA